MPAKRHLTKPDVEITELKQLVRDRIAPGRALGHSDRARSEHAE